MRLTYCTYDDNLENIISVAEEVEECPCGCIDFEQLLVGNILKESPNYPEGMERSFGLSIKPKYVYKCTECGKQL